MHPGADTIASDGPWPPRNSAEVGRHHIDGDGPPGRNGRAIFASGPSRRKAFVDILLPPEGGGFQPRLASRCWFAVRRPGNPALLAQAGSPRSHGMPCRGLVLGNACAYLIIVNMFDYTTMRREGVAFLAGLRPGLGAAILMAGGRTASGLGTPGDPGGI